MPSLQELVKEKKREQELQRKIIPDEKFIPEIEKFSEEEILEPILTPKDFEIKTDHFRTGISLITSASKRDKPPILKEKLLEFLNNHELIKKGNTWYWSNKFNK